MQVFSQVDYIKFKSKKPLLPIDTVENASGNFKYQSVTPLGRILWGHNKSDKFSHILTGANCAEYRNRKISDRKALTALIEDGAEFTRIDLAITVNGDYLEQLASYATNARGALRDGGIKNIEDGDTRKYETIYIGDTKKRGKKGIFRGYRYDIAHGLDIDLTRFELECGKNNAQASVKRLINGTSIGANIRYYLDFPNWQLWQDITSGEIHEVYRGKSASEDENEKTQSRINWLMSQVSPALAQVMFDSMMKHGNHDVYHDFIAQTKSHYNDIVGSHLTKS